MREFVAPEESLEETLDGTRGLRQRNQSVRVREGNSTFYRHSDVGAGAAGGMKLIKEKKRRGDLKVGNHNEDCSPRKKYGTLICFNGIEILIHLIQTIHITLPRQ